VPSAPFEFHPKTLPGSSSVTVLCSRCVPNCFATVEKVDPIAIGPSESFVTCRTCPAYSPCFVKSLT
jgi:hypothetical protein